MTPSAYAPYKGKIRQGQDVERCAPLSSQGRRVGLMPPCACRPTANADTPDMEEVRRCFARFDREDLLEALQDGR
jgi:hypothetical protein